MTSVLVGVDGSDCSRRAAKFARDLARAFQAKLTLLHVIEPFPMGALTAFDAPQSEYYDQQMRHATALLGEIADELGAEDAERAIEMGHASEVIAREAAERHADHIVVGSHGHRPGARVIIGSVGAQLASLSGRTITIVR